MTIFSPDVAEDEIQATIEAVLGYITSASGEEVTFNRDSPWGRRRLAYAIRYNSRDVRDGFYTLFHFSVAPHRISDIEREIKLNDRIMRYLLTLHTPVPVEAVPATEGEATAAEGVPTAVAGEPVAAEAEPTAVNEAEAVDVATDDVADAVVAVDEGTTEEA
jgi:small subunit ribosomal protein S6